MTENPPRHTFNRRRWLYFSIAASMVPIGLLARSFRDSADSTSVIGFISTYLGDTVWAVMFFFLFSGCLPRWRTHWLAALTLCFTLAIEFSQRYHGQPLLALRSFSPTRFLLGTHFLWSDVVCLLAGTSLAAMLHYGLFAARR